MLWLARPEQDVIRTGHHWAVSKTEKRLHELPLDRRSTAGERLKDRRAVGYMDFHGPSRLKDPAPLREHARQLGRMDVLEDVDCEQLLDRAIDEGQVPKRRTMFKVVRSPVLIYVYIARSGELATAQLDS